MKAFLRRSDWVTSLLIFAMPITLVFFLGVQMAYSEVQSEVASYAALTEYTNLAALQAVAPGSTILLRGQLAESTALLPAQPAADAAGPLLIYQERPRQGREVRFMEEFPLVFPPVVLMLADGTINVQSNAESARAISHELHHLTLADREFTGFQVGDMITLQGKWQPLTSGQPLPFVVDVTGISGFAKTALQAEVQAGLQKVRLAKDGLGLLTLAGIVLLGIRLYRQRRQPPTGLTGLGDEAEEEGKEWRPPTTETVPTT